MLVKDVRDAFSCRSVHLGPRSESLRMGSGYVLEFWVSGFFSSDKRSPAFFFYSFPNSFPSCLRIQTPPEAIKGFEAGEDWRLVIDWVLENGRPSDAKWIEDRFRLAERLSAEAEERERCQSYGTESESTK